MSAPQQNANNDGQIIYKGEDQNLTFDDITRFLTGIGFKDLDIKENSFDYRVINELVNEYEFYKSNFATNENKLEIYKKCKETIEKIKLAVSNYKNKQNSNKPIIDILDNVEKYIEIHKKDNKQNKEILDFINNLVKDLREKDLNQVIQKYYSSSIISLLDTYDETRIKILIKTKETNNFYQMLFNNKIKLNDTVIISENDKFDNFKIFILLNIQENQEKYLLNILNLQIKKEEQMQITKYNNYYCIIDDNNKIKGIKIGEYKK